MIDALLHPSLSASVLALFRMGYGVLLFGTLLLILPEVRRFFVSERWGGYAGSSPGVDWIQNPIVLPVLMTVWFGCALLIVVDWWTVPAALVNLILCRYFFVWMRWRGVLRGMGAPGFMTYWLAAAVLLLEYTTRYAPDVFPLALLVIQVDWAFIILSSGIYKFTAGYPRNHGMELGLVNPQWGYWWSAYRRLRTSQPLFWGLNQLAWTSEIVAGVLMLIPATRFLGGLLIVLSFAFVATQIRLSLLCWMVVLSGVLFFDPGSPGGHWIEQITAGPAARDLALANTPMVSALNTALTAALWAYLGLLPLAHVGLFYNFYGHRSLPPRVQYALERYTNFFGIIIWRVFSVDHLNFTIQIYVQDRSTGTRTLISHYGFGGTRRFNQVAEAITITTLFTTLKYHPQNSELFVQRLVRYARTLPGAASGLVVFEYVSILKQYDAFVFRPVAEYVVDVAEASVKEIVLDQAVSVHAAHAVSPVHEGARPGSYAPVGN